MALSKFLDPKNDVAFRRIFGSVNNKDILIHFLNDILDLTDVDQIKDVSFLSPIQDPEIISQKQSIVDILCTDSNGVQMILEMQVAKTTGFPPQASRNVLNIMLLKPIQVKLIKVINIIILKGSFLLLLLILFYFLINWLISLIMLLLIKLLISMILKTLASLL